MSGIEVVVGFLIAWFVRKVGRVGKRLDDLADETLDAGLERLHGLVATKLGGDSAFKQLEAEVTATGEATDRTRDRLRLALEEASERDPSFAANLGTAVAQLPTSVADGHGVVIGRDVRADSGVAIVAPGGTIRVERPDPSAPGGRSPRT